MGPQVAYGDTEPRNQQAQKGTVGGEAKKATEEAGKRQVR